MRKIGEFLLANDRNAAIVALLFALLPVFQLPGGFVASIIVGFITLQKGHKSGLFVLLWVALPAVSMFVLRRFGLFDTLLLRCLMVYVFALILRKYNSWTLVLEVGAILGIITVVALHLIIPDMKSWWTAHINQYIKEISQAATWKLSTDETKTMIDRMVPIATGISASVVFLGIVVELLLARWWQTAIFQPGTLRREFVNIRFGRITASIMTLIIIGVVANLSYVVDFFPVTLIPFMIAGLSLMHLSVEKNRNLFIPVLLVYIGLLFLPFVVVGLLALAGYVDSWVDFRSRFIKQKQTKSTEV